MLTWVPREHEVMKEHNADTVCLLEKRWSKKGPAAPYPQSIHIRRSGAIQKAECTRLGDAAVESVQRNERGAADKDPNVIHDQDPSGGAGEAGEAGDNTPLRIVEAVYYLDGEF
jgi:hypothetical protein